MVYLSDADHWPARNAITVNQDRPLGSLPPHHRRHDDVHRKSIAPQIEEITGTNMLRQARLLNDVKTNAGLYRT